METGPSILSHLLMSVILSPQLPQLPPSRRQIAPLFVEAALTLESEGSVISDLTKVEVTAAVSTLTWNAVRDFWMAPGACVPPC